MKSLVSAKTTARTNARDSPVTCPDREKGDLSIGPELPQSLEDVQLPDIVSHEGCGAMSDRVTGAPVPHRGKEYSV